MDAWWRRRINKMKAYRNGFAVAALALATMALITAPSAPALAQLQGRAAQMDANKNGVIDRDEARGPFASEFDTIDKDKSGTLDGDEVSAFVQARFGGNRGGGAPGARAGGGAPGVRGFGRPTFVSVDPVTSGPVTETVPLFGRIVANQSGVIASRVKGPVGEIRVKVGDRVKKGDVLAVIVSDTLSAERDLTEAELTEFVAKVRTSQAQLDLANQELKRLERLRQSAAFPAARYEDKRMDVARLRSVLAETQSRVAQARAKLKMADIDLAYATIRAPYEGTVSERQTDVGAYLSVGAPVVTLINDRSLEVEAEVPAVRVPGLTPGREIAGHFENDGAKFRAKVRAIVPEENALARTRTVRFSADLQDEGPPPAVNQSVVLAIPIGPVHDAVSLHKDAVVLRDGRPAVFVVNGDNKAELRPVQLGAALGERFVVTSGVRPGDKVVTRGNEGLRPNQNVQIRTGAPGEGGDS